MKRGRQGHPVKPRTLEWPRYEIGPVLRTGLGVFDTWAKRRVMATFGGSKRDRKQTVTRSRSQSEYQARRRVARLRRAIIDAGEVSRAAADRIARHLDVDGIGRFDWWFR